MLKVNCLISLLAVLIFLSACQQNPEEDIVVNKNDGVFESIAGQENTDGAAGAPEEITVNYSETFKNNEGDITITVALEEQVLQGAMPIVRVKPHEITSEEVQHWAEVLFEGHTAYEQTDVMTRAEVEEYILMLRQKISDKDALVREYGSEAEAQRMIEYYENQLSAYEQAWETAPETYEKKECDWTFHTADYYMSDARNIEDSAYDDYGSYIKTREIRAETRELSGGRAVLSVVNRNESDYSMNCMDFYYTDKDSLPAPQKTGTAQEAISMADQVLKDLKLENWSYWNCFDFSTESENQYRVRYTLSYGDWDVIQSPEIDLKSEDLYASNYGYSVADVEIANGKVTSVSVASPMDVVNVENENVNTIDFQRACQLLKNHLQSSYTRSSCLDPMDPNYDSSSLELKITRVHRGLFRIREKDSGEFLFVPVWSFNGSLLVNGSDWTGPEDSDRFFINAVDGSIINTNLGY